MNTEFLTLSPDAPDEAVLHRAAAILCRGGLVVFPTETVYGLGADGTCAEAAMRIYRAKGRPSDNPLILHIETPADAADYAYTNETYEKLAAAFMPGPLTVVLRAKESVPLQTRGGLPTVAVRCPESLVARRLIACLGKPIAAPSANLSGSPSPTCAAHVRDDMDGRVDMILDGGDCEIGLESTIVKIEDDGSLLLLRPGGITVDALRRAVGEVRISDAVTAALAPGERVQSPGMKYRHYAPKAPLTLLKGTTEKRIAYIRVEGKARVGVLCYEEERAAYAAALPEAQLFSLGKADDMRAQAHRLFYHLREADKAEFEKLYAPLPEKDGMGLALYNRLIRAASYDIQIL